MTEQDDRDRGWMQFHEKEVMIQLKAPYVGVNPDSMLPQVQMDKEGKQQTTPDGTPILTTTPFMQGMLFVERDEHGLVLKLAKRFRMGESAQPLVLLVVIAPETIAFCTTYEVQRIVSLE